MGISGAGFGAAKALEQILAEQMVRAQNVQREREAQQRMALEQQRIDEAIKQNSIANERQTWIDDEHAADRRQRSNQAGVRRMIGDSLVQRRGPMTSEDRRDLAALQVEAGDMPDMSLLSEPSPKRTVITTIGRRGEPIRKSFTDAELEQGVPEYQEPRSAPQPDYEWVMRGNQPTQIRRGTAQPGDRPYEKPAASNAPDPNKAYETRTKILEAARGLKDAPGKAAMTGARGWSYGLGLSGENPLPGTPAASAKAKYDTLKSLLTLDNLSLLKGAMSDKDLLFLQSAGTALNSAMDDATFDAELDKIIQKFESVQGNTSGQTKPDLSGVHLVYDPVTKTFKQGGGS